MTLCGASSVAAQPPVGPSSAAPSASVLLVEVSVAPAFCAAIGDVEREVTRRSQRVRFAPTGAGPRQVTVVGLGPGRSEQVGAAVTLRTVSDAESRRELWAKSCDELVRAVGLVIAITYDPPSPEAAEPSREVEPVPAASKVRTTSRGPLGSPAPPPRSVPRRAETSAEFDARSPGAQHPDVSEVHWRAGLGGTAGWGVAPSPLWGAAVFAAMSWGPRHGAGGFVRLAAAGDVSGAEAFAGGVAVFRRWSGQLALGPEWHLGAVHLGAVATGRAGLVRAQGRATLEPQSYDRLWLEAGGAVFGRMELFAGWYLEAEVGVSKPLTRYAFQFDPVVFHRVSSRLTHVGIAASAAF